MLKVIIALLEATLTEKNMKLVADALLDKIEDIVVDSANTIDDQLVLPAVQKIRDAFGIADNDPV